MVVEAGSPVALLRRRRGVPAWSPFRHARGHQRFVALLEDRLRLGAIGFERGDGDAYRLDDGREVHVGELAQLCAVTDEAEWRELIALRLDALRIARARSADRAPQPGPAQTGPAPTATVREPGLRDAVRPRLLTSDDATDLDDCVSREVADGLVEVVALDHPGSVEVPARSRLAGLRLSDAGLLALAGDNLRAHERPQLIPDETGGVDVLIAESDGFFTSSWALHVAELVAVDARRGALVGIPTRHSLILHPIHDAGARQAIGLMLPMIRGAHAHAPAALSGQLWWWRRSGLTAVPLALDGDRLALAPPAELAAVLDSLA